MKGSTDADFALVFNKTYRSMSWGPGLDEGGQNFQNMPSLWRHLQKTLTENEKRFFPFRAEDLLNPWMV